jgi:hypothetical protein
MNDPDGDLAAVRRDVAAGRRFAPAAAQFLTGDTLAEVEARADEFARLVNSHAPTEQERTASMGDLLAAASAAKQARRAALVEALVAPSAQQPRDASGRWTTGSSFDGGARADGGMPAEPETHGQWLGRILRTREADAGVGF